MQARWLLPSAALALLAGACLHTVDDGDAPLGAAGSAGSGSTTPPPPGSSGDANTADDTSDDGADAEDGSAGADGATGDPTADENGTDEHGVVDDGPGGIPSDAHASCAQASDCGADTDTEVFGFACVDDVCTCDPGGSALAACTDAGGSWSPFECACFENTGSAMPLGAPPPPGAVGNEDDVVCWYRWKDLGCDPDRWVDTSYDEWVCDGPDDCYWDWVEDGYYEDGDCYGRWVTRCDDGNEYW